MQIHRKMVFTTTKLSELPLYNTLSFTPSSSSSCSSPPCFLKSHKNSIFLFKSFCSLKTTQTNKNPPPKTSSSAPWLKKWPSMDPPPPTTPTNSVSDNVVSSRNIVESRGSSSAIDRIVGKLRNLGLEDDDDEEEDEDEGGGKPEKLGDLLRRDWIRDDAMLIEEKKSDFGLLPWEKDEVGEEEEFGKVNEVRESVKKTKRVVKPPTLAEKTIEEAELKRLRGQGMVLKDKVNVAKAGVTQSVLEKIHAKWRKSELVRLKFHEDLAHDMKTAHILVERRTGGLVLWRSGSVMVVYRGTNYKGPELDSAGQIVVNTTAETIAAEMPHKHRHTPTAEEREYNDLLDGLGPRFGDWWGTGLLPIDADLLPQTVPGYKPPRRLLPVGMRVGLTNAELTDLRKLAKTLPCHFALGRNRNHQGLAAAIVKLWEKSVVAKIAVKRGIQNTNNELMSEELKKLTGGTLLLRNKFFIVIYRGKDFLPTTVAAAVTERMEVTKRIEDAEEEARSATIDAATTDEHAPAFAGTLAEFYEAQARWGRETSPEEYEKMKEEASRAKTVKVVKRIEHKLALAQSKKLRAESLLSKIEASMVPVGPSDDQETITDEERFTFRKIGLQMKAYLPVGVRGIFDGVIENMHLHWKHRELVKLISKQKNLGFVEETARLLEYESGGILVAIERVPKGYALIYYRGKNYQRPISLRPRNLLTKAKALKRAIAMQRHEALSEHITELEKNIDEMRKEMGSSETSKDENVLRADGEFRPMSEYQSEDEDSGDEDDDEDSDIYDSDDDEYDDDGDISNVEDGRDGSLKVENW